MAEPLAGRYEILAVVGRGGEATVLKARDLRHDRLVALKARRVPDDASAAQAQLAETKALLTLPGHDGLAHARDDFFDDGQHYLVLDWVEGIDLARVLGEQGTPGLPAAAVVRWLAQAAAALTVMHGRGVIHGDLKPANLVLDERGRVVTVDLGSSSVPEAGGRTGGTPRYRAPEVAAGQPVTRAADVYGLAATAFALLTGSPPAGVLPAWETIEPNRAAAIEAALRAGLSVDPTRRPASPGEFVERLRAGLDDRIPTGVTTVLLTDVVGSTALWAQQPERTPALLAGMQLAVDLAVEANGGDRVGATVEGDSTVSVFVTATDALHAAIAIQRSVRDPNAGIDAAPVRIGLATGELAVGGGDVAGPTVSRAARVRDLAGAGQVLLSGTTAEVVAAANVGGVRLVPLGPHRLRGLDNSDEIFAVDADGVDVPPDPSRCPYPGLAPFGSDDVSWFVGREALVDDCLARLASDGFVGLIGGSGTGKSSIALAGIAPRLGRSVVLTPGEHPLEALRFALEAADELTTIIVDQLEEVVTLCRDQQERAAFLYELRSRPGGVVVTLRADVYGELAGYGAFSEVLAAGHVLVGPLAPDDLVRAIVEPAASTGLSLESGLTELIVSELADEPGILPLLAHALRETWERRDGRRLTIGGYRAAGGVARAIATTADAAFDGLAEHERSMAQDMVLRMVEIRDDGEDARRWVPLAELVGHDGGTAAAVLERLIAARLVIVEAAKASIAHEALLRAWPALAEWVNQQRGTLLVRQQCRRAAALWVEGGRAAADLYRGGRLAAALDATGGGSALGPDEIEFLEESRRNEQRDADAARRSARRLRALLAGVSVFAVVATVAGAIALAARSRADDARDAADLSRLVALVGATRTDQPDLAMLLAVEAYERADTAATRGALVDALTARAALRGFLQGSPSTVEAVAVSPDGTQLATTARGVVQLWDATNLGRREQIAIGEGQLYSFDYAPDGSIVAALPDDAALAQTSAERELARVSLEGGPLAIEVDVVPDVAWVLREDPFDQEAAPFVEARALDTLDVLGEPIVVQDGAPIVAIAGGPEGSVALGLADGAVWIADAAGALTSAPVDPAHGPVEDLDWQHDLLAVARGGGAVELLRTTPTVELLTSFELDDAVSAVAVSLDGSMVAAGTEDGQAVVRELESGGTVLDVRAAHAGRVNAVALTADGSTLVTGGYDGKGAVFALDGDLEFGPVRRSGAPLVGEYTADGSILSATNLDEGADVELIDPGAARPAWTTPVPGPVTDLASAATVVVAMAPGPNGPSLWLLDTESGERRAQHSWPDADRVTIAVAPDGARVWVAIDDAEADGSTLVELDAATGAEVTATAVEDDVVSITALPDGDRVVTGHLVGDAAVRDVDEGFAVTARSQQTVDDIYLVLAVDPRGAAVAAAGLAGPVALLDPITLQPLHAPLEGHRSPVTGLAIGDGGTLVSTSADGTSRLWDIDAGETIGGPIPTSGPSEPGVAVDATGGRALVQGAHGLLEFDLRPAQWVAAACRLAGRELTDSERDAVVRSGAASPCQ